MWIQTRTQNSMINQPKQNLGKITDWIRWNYRIPLIIPNTQSRHKKEREIDNKNKLSPSLTTDHKAMHFNEHKNYIQLKLRWDEFIEFKNKNKNDGMIETNLEGGEYRTVESEWTPNPDQW